MDKNNPVVILSCARTPIGGFGGVFKDISAPELGGASIKAALERGGLASDQIDAVFMGCVLPAGLGQAPARQAGYAAGLDDAVGAMTVNKMCGSGLYAAMLAHDLITARTHNIVIAGGMENMSRAPYLLPKARSGYKIGHDRIFDHMFFDGLEDVYEPGRLMGVFAEDCADHYGFTRKDQDNFAVASLERAQKAQEENLFDREITPVQIQARGKNETLNKDEQPSKASREKIPNLKPAFKPDGTITAANASSISDGAAALALSSLSYAESIGVRPKGRIAAHAVHAQAPKWFTTAPVGAIRAVLEKAGWEHDEVDLFEINEAFACVPMAVMKELELSYDKVNIYGGACALGHPIGASGARVLTTLISALEHTGLRKGVAALCLGGGEAVAMAVELEND